MKHKGPIITLLAGLAVAAVLMVLNLSVSNAGSDANDGNDAVGVAATTTTTERVKVAPAPIVTRNPTAQVTYAGRVNGGAATIAIAIYDGKAVAYLCDGKRAEAWLKGSATDGQLSLTGAHNASLSGGYGNGRATGSVTATGKRWTFSVGTVTKPSGLYRATANVRNAKVVGGWIVLANGEQVGLLSVAGAPEEAPPLDPTANSVTVGGVPIPVNEVDGSGL
jgi:hypothetical protein